MKALFPHKLPKNGTIGIISPASPQHDMSRLDKGIRYLEGLGYSVKVGRYAREHHAGYLAGTDVQRLSDLHEMFLDPQVDAIFCSRGGYGSARLLPGLNVNLIKKHPKILVGFSDITSLQLALWKRIGLVTFSGAMPSVDMADRFDPASEEQFWRVLTSNKPLGTLKQSPTMNTIQRGDVQGRIVGGNLSVMCSLFGTPFMPSLRGSILVLEDVGEETYRIDRMLTQVAQATRSGRPAGVAYGFWSQASRPIGTTPHRDVQEVLEERCDVSRGPILAGLLYGHESTKRTLPFGVMARLSSRTKRFSLIESAVQ
ncbi:MAG: LD-carboxypeptidase [Candidatus Kapabacteria bacterium]|nr:LD-carboxypeptidase [Candidatus Kapabacteria bacterium]